MKLRMLASFATIAAVGLSGCVNVQNLPLPGGASVGDDPVTFKIEFADVLDLNPQSSVRVNDLPVGRVDTIERDGWSAVMTVTINNRVDLPDNAQAQIRQTNLLGEKFVSLEMPADPQGKLGQGDVIPLSRTGANPDIEQVLGAFSLILNGGSIDRLQIISSELGTAFEGREADTRVLIDRLGDLVETAATSKDDIIRALEQVDRLSQSTQAQSANINAALDSFPAGLTTLEQQRNDLVRMLSALSQLGSSATRVIDASTAATKADLAALRPILSNLADTRQDLVTSLRLLPTFPFPDAAFGDNAQDAKNRQIGDYLNATVNFNTDFQRTWSKLTNEERNTYNRYVRLKTNTAGGGGANAASAPASPETGAQQILLKAVMP